jgi:hypothetical protein
MANERKITKCCICQENFRGFGNNPRPLKSKGLCCDTCNFRYVIPSRIYLIKKNDIIKRKLIRK